LDGFFFNVYPVVCVPYGLTFKVSEFCPHTTISLNSNGRFVFVMETQYVLSKVESGLIYLIFRLFVP